VTTTSTRRAAAKKTTPAKKAAAKTVPVRKAGPGVVLDLDNLTKGQAMPGLKLPTRSFTFLLGGADYELRDPRDTDWKLSLELSANPFLLMRTCLVNADDPVAEPTKEEWRLCRERHGLTPDPPPAGTPEAEHEAESWPDGPPPPAVIDRFTATDLPGWKLNALFARWHEHYKIDLSEGKGVLAALLGKDT
jgi:hypothetical protein